VDALSFVGALRRNDKTRVARETPEKRRKGRKDGNGEKGRGEDNNDDDDHRLVATVAGNGLLYL